MQTRSTLARLPDSIHSNPLEHIRARLERIERALGLEPLPEPRPYTREEWLSRMLEICPELAEILSRIPAP